MALRVEPAARVRRFESVESRTAFVIHIPVTSGDPWLQVSPKVLEFGRFRGRVLEAQGQ